MKFPGSIKATPLILVSALALVAAACGPRRASEVEPDLRHESEEAVEYFEHRVRFPGETLAILAAWYTGSTDNWVILAEHNPVIRADKIEIGDLIFVPELMMIRKEPLAESFIAARRTKKSATSVPQTKPDPVREDAPAVRPEARDAVPLAAGETGGAPAPRERSVTDEKESLEEWQRRVREALKIRDAQPEPDSADPKSDRRYEALEELLGD